MGRRVATPGGRDAPPRPVITTSFSSPERAAPPVITTSFSSPERENQVVITGREAGRSTKIRW
ncbi:MAG: hypothetical protein QOC93_704 [Actinomycetota bacterium]|nr:hypothetical protein [Actinomycetota bacterium]